MWRVGQVTLARAASLVIACLRVDSSAGPRAKELESVVGE